MSLLELFCNVDDYCQEYQQWISKKAVANAKKKPGPKPKMSQSEIMTIVILFHQSGFRNFKHYYTSYVAKYLSQEFPKLLSYNRFLELMQEVILPLTAYLRSRFGKNTGISFIDSTPIVVCHNRRIKRNKVFKDLAARGKNGMGWFYGFKLHLIVNDLGELLAVYLTPGNTDDGKPVKDMTQGMFGKIFADKGYISKELFTSLFERNLELITYVRKNMKNSLMKIQDSLLLRKRFIIETINDQLKNISQIEHSRHRKPVNFAVNLIAGLIAYTFQEKKPSINWPDMQGFDIVV